MEKHYFDLYLSVQIQENIERFMSEFEYLTNPNRTPNMSKEDLYNQFATGNGAWVLENYDLDVYVQMRQEYEGWQKEMEDDLESSKHLK